MKVQKFRDIKGITLVALVITIIILLILSGITIAQLTENKLFENVKLAKEKSNNAQEIENDTLGDYENKIDDSIGEKEKNEVIDENTFLLLKGENFLNSGLGNYNNIINNGVTVSEGGKKGRCFYFNGSSYFKLENTNLIDVSKDFTIDFWVKFLEYPSHYSTLFRIGGNNTGEAACTVGLYTINNNLCLMTSGGGRGWDISSNSTTFEKDKWIYVAIVKKENEMFLYKDGEKVGVRTFTSELNTTQLNFFGRDSDIGGQYFNGYIDEIRISNIARWTEDKFDITK